MEARHEERQEDLEEAGVVVLNYESVDIDVNGNAIYYGRLCEYGFETSMRKRQIARLSLN